MHVCKYIPKSMYLLLGVLKSDLTPVAPEEIIINIQSNKLSIIKTLHFTYYYYASSYPHHSCELWSYVKQDLQGPQKLSSLKSLKIKNSTSILGFLILQPSEIAALSKSLS